jgi:hypothetical protein
VPSCKQHGTLKQSHYPLQDRRFRISTHSNLGNSARNQARLRGGQERALLRRQPRRAAQVHCPVI